MATATARAPKTIKVEAEILDENQAAALCALPLHQLREWSVMGTLPGGVWRAGRDYFINIEQASRLRELRAGVSPAFVFRAECEIEDRKAAELGKNEREAMARGDALCAATRERERKEAEDRWTARMAQDAKNKAAQYAASGVRLS